MSEVFFQFFAPDVIVLRDKKGVSNKFSACSYLHFVTAQRYQITDIRREIHELDQLSEMWWCLIESSIQRGFI